MIAKDSSIIDSQKYLNATIYNNFSINKTVENKVSITNSRASGSEILKFKDYIVSITNDPPIIAKVYQ